MNYSEVMQQSFATTAPMGLGNNRDIDFSLCKARVYALHYGDIFYVKSLVKFPPPDVISNPII